MKAWPQHRIVTLVAAQNIFGDPAANPNQELSESHFAVPASVPVLMYHSISEEGQPAFLPFCVSKSQFETELEILAAGGFETLTVSELVRYRAEGIRLPRNSVVLTFDDGFADFHTTAVPMMRKFGFRATLYLTTGFVGGTSRWLASSGEGDRPMMSWDDVRDCSNAGMEIGAHTVTHLALDRLQHDTARQEIETSKRHIEEAIGKEVTSFAYPFGYYSPAVRQLVQKAGFRSACGVRYAPSPAHDDTFLLARLIVRRSCSNANFQSILRGHPPLFETVRDQARSSLWHFVRQTFPRA